MHIIFIILAVLGFVFSLISVLITISVINRFSGKLRSALIWGVITLIILFLRTLLRLADTAEIIYLSPAIGEYINVGMNFVLTLLTLIAMLNVKQVVRIIDGKVKKKK